MKHISWITPTCYVDVDLYILKELYSQYNIHWIVILQPTDGINTKQYIERTLGENKNIKITYVWQKYRQRSLRNIKFIWDFIQLAKSTNPEIIYTSEYAQPFGILLYKLLLPIHKTIAACHNVTTPQGARKERFARFYTNLWLKSFINIQTFSKSQCQILQKKYKNKNILMAYLALKDYGMPTIIKQKDDNIIRFLVFGNIVKYKRIDLLLKAVNILYDKGIRGFKIRIAGNCKEWDEEYFPIIKYPELFDLQIKRIPNEDIANLFADSDYFVMPYQDIAQSGAITVAFRYNLPVICSDIKQFEEFIIDGETGFSFENKNEFALANKMEWIIKNHSSIYQTIKNKQQIFIEKNLSTEVIVNKYISYINKL
jgi:glycosyltransferase involved in cell wall biosynthesis